MSSNKPLESVFVTGGTGFLGGHLRDALASEGLDVTLLVRPTTDVQVRPNESVRRGDVTAPENFELGNPDAIVHLAGQTSIETAIESPRTTWEINATGTLNLLEAARDADDARFVYASTASVYGPPEKLPISEDHPMYPAEPYGGSKAAADRLVHAYHRTYGLDTVTARIFNTFGPGQPTHNVVPAIIEQALTDETVELGNLSPSRDFLYVEDTVGALLTLLRSGERGEAYNVGRGEDTEIGELAGLILELIDRDVELVSTADRQRDEGVEIPRHVSDSSKLRSLGWSPDYDLEAGLKATIDAVSTKKA
ncbi:NAD-dependent epimerase/dehydratase family protein [Halegenticoccus soli]|uniref:NAD-dependent epimerase/dehydratase family protein n=1 Tax=Halegenticoccus soli TaxID=1985678 RepID=UPI000C6E3DE7|nr:NAD-dependent epimerase/dehydratase family protein [Halegenticoccus soli]